jgi:hypothetical protein
MIILDKVKSFDGQNIEIEIHHRVHLSLFHGAHFDYCFLPNYKQDKKYQFSELIISPIGYSAWNDLWRITLTLKEGIGIVNKVLKIVSSYNLNILTYESNTLKDEDLHYLEIIVDATLYYFKTDKHHDDRTRDGETNELHGLKTLLMSSLIDIINIEDKEPKIRINRIRGLFNSVKEFQKHQEIQLRNREQFEPKVGKGDIISKKNGSSKTSYLKLDEGLIQVLKEMLVNSRNPGKYGNYLCVSDTQERFLRILFFQESVSIINPIIQNIDKIGALDKITEALQDASLNIITSFSRIGQFGNVAHNEFVLTHDNTSLSENDLKELLRKQISTKELIHEYKIKIAYKNSHGLIKDNEWTELHEVLVIPKSHKYDKNPSNILRDFIDSHEAGAEKDVDARLEIAKKNLETFDIIFDSKQAKKTIFFSYPFSDNDLHQKCRGECEKAGFFYSDAQHVPQQRIREGVIELIRDCHVFVGIWTVENGIKTTAKKNGSNSNGEQCWMPSAWLPWEWGVAQALGKPTFLCISEKIRTESWSKISHDVQHTFFKDFDFEAQLKSLLDKIIKLENNR